MPVPVRSEAVETGLLECAHLMYTSPASAVPLLQLVMGVPLHRRLPIRRLVASSVVVWLGAVDGEVSQGMVKVKCNEKQLTWACKKCHT